MSYNEWSVRIVRVSNGYELHFAPEEHPEFSHTEVFQDEEMDDLKSIEEVLNVVVDYFAKSGGRYDKERIFIRREPGDKYGDGLLEKKEDDGIPF